MILPDQHMTSRQNAGSVSAIRASISTSAMGWLAAFVVLAVFVIVRIDLFPLRSPIVVDGEITSVPRAFFTVDHPFHTARSSLIRGAWSSLDSVRWVANHHGGYPSEFFPLGLPGAAALISLVTFGALSIPASWAIVIVGMFLLPALAYVLVGREDGLSPAVALIAFAAHVSIASDWTHGGYTELVEWGLATNVAGATLALLAVPFMVGAVRTRGTRFVAIAGVLIAICAVTNPRSLLGVAIMAIAIVGLQLRKGAWRSAVWQTAAVAVLSAALAAPVLAPLIRYRDLYSFLSYEEYASLRSYLEESAASVSWPVLLSALIGIALALVRRRHDSARVCAVGLVLYVVLTTVAIVIPSFRELIPQLELPRLMPFQRLLTLYLAAYGLVELTTLVAPAARTRAMQRDAVLALTTVITVVIVFTTNVGPITAAEQGLRHVPRIEGQDAVELQEFEQAIELADSSAPLNTSILVLGSRLSWHERLWAPMFAEDRRFYYNHWLWYWHERHDGPYNFRQGHFYPNPSETLTDAYLREHGIGAVVVTDVSDAGSTTNVRRLATESPLLELSGDQGFWSVFTVQNPMSLATLDDAEPSSLETSSDNETITMRFQDANPGEVKIRQNWFPRWTAEVNGESQMVERSEDGYMTVPIEFSGDADIVLRYSVTLLDVVGRALFVIAAAITLIMLVRPTAGMRWWSDHRSPTKHPQP